MPWSSEELNSLIKKGRDIISNEFSIDSQVPIYNCSEDEMSTEIIKELETLNFSSKEIESIKKFQLPFIIGKYFRDRNEIWLVNPVGCNLSTLLHELIHSFQKCSPNRDNIADYIAFKFTGDTSHIIPENLKEWKEIERQVGFKRIKNQILVEKDCEDF